jgi:hypothetical protein
MTTPRVRVIDHLPGFYREIDPDGVLAGLLAAFDELLDGLLAEIHGRDGVGGICDLWDPATTPPPQFPDDGQRSDDLAFLALIAGWLDLPLRPPPAHDAAWNRAFLQAVLPVLDRRGTLHGLDTLLRAWLAGQVVDGLPLLITDLASRANAAPSAIQLDVTATLAVDTVLGDGPAGYFVVDVVLDPANPALRRPNTIDACQRAVRQLLDSERPAHTTYQLRLRGTTLQLAPQDKHDQQDGEVYARLEGPSGEEGAPGTALLWSEPWTYDSD